MAKTEEPADIHYPRKLENKDDVHGFQSGADELDEWLTQFARINQRANNATTYVATTEDRRVVGYYAIAVAGVSKQLVPSKVAGVSPPTDVPCILLARLAVDWEHQNRGIGQALFTDALRRAVILSESVGVRALLIHARDENARNFYMKHADLCQSPTDPLHLMITIHLIKAAMTKSALRSNVRQSPAPASCSTRFTSK